MMLYVITHIATDRKLIVDGAISGTLYAVADTGVGLFREALNDPTIDRADIRLLPYWRQPKPFVITD